MKVSIIIGVIHMMFGVFVGLWNHQFFRRRINVICEFIPQIIFMTFLFFYLCILIFHKWVNYSAIAGKITWLLNNLMFMNEPIFQRYKTVIFKTISDKDPDLLQEGAHCAPSVLITFINMVLFKTTEKVGDCEPYMYGGQNGFQRFLVVIAVLCVPWMLCAKPYLIFKQRQLQHNKVIITCLK